MSHQHVVLDTSRTFSSVNDLLEVGRLSVTRKVVGTGELNEMDKVDRIAVRLVSVAESEPRK